MEYNTNNKRNMQTNDDFLSKCLEYFKIDKESYDGTEKTYETVKEKHKYLEFVNNEIAKLDTITKNPFLGLSLEKMEYNNKTLKKLRLRREILEQELSIAKHEDVGEETSSLLQEVKNKKPLLEYYGNCIEGKGFNFLLANTGYGKTTLATQIDTLLSGSRPHFENHDLLVDDGVLEQCNNRVILKYDLEQSEHAMLAVFNDRTGRNQNESIAYTKGTLTITRNDLWQIERESEKPLYQILIENVKYHIRKNPDKEIVVIIDNLTKLIEGELASERDIKPVIVALESLYLEANKTNKEGLTMLVILHTNKYTSGKKLELDMAKGSSIIQSSATRITAIGKIENPNYQSRASHYIKILKARSIAIDDSNGKAHLCKIINEDPKGNYYRHFQFLYEKDNEGKDVPYMVSESALLKTREQVESEEQQAQEQEMIKSGASYDEMKENGWTKSERAFYNMKKKNGQKTTKEVQQERKETIIKSMTQYAVSRIDFEGNYTFETKEEAMSRYQISRDSYYTYKKIAEGKVKEFIAKSEAENEENTVDKDKLEINKINNVINKEKESQVVVGGLQNEKPLTGISKLQSSDSSCDSDKSKIPLTNERPKINNSKGKKSIESKPKQESKKSTNQVIQTLDSDPKKDTNQMKNIDPLSIEKDESLMKLFNNIRQPLTMSMVTFEGMRIYHIRQSQKFKVPIDSDFDISRHDPNQNIKEYHVDLCIAFVLRYFKRKQIRIPKKEPLRQLIAYNYETHSELHDIFGDKEIGIPN